jgi:hypothetical protein
MFNNIVSTKKNLLRIIDILSTIEKVDNPYLTDEYRDKISVSVNDISLAAEIFLKRLSSTDPCQPDWL